MNYVSWFPSKLQGKAVPSTVTILKSSIRSKIIKHHPLVTWQSLGQSEAFLPLSPGWPQPITDFPAIEPSMLSHNTEVI